ncbi:Eukaryotic translation initiation factor 2B, subunit 4 delta, 67kDa [Rhizophlyctis rosea]|nr:Eukaryotic translation initiation factor 2B, subunit 4 delta, 67kDa [Rhizophlyctis rosea]
MEQKEVQADATPKDQKAKAAVKPPQQQPAQPQAADENADGTKKTKEQKKAEKAQKKAARLAAEGQTPGAPQQQQQRGPPHQQQQQKGPAAGQPEKKSQKEMTKAERREKQEREREAKKKAEAAAAAGPSATTPSTPSAQKADPFSSSASQPATESRTRKKLAKMAEAGPKSLSLFQHLPSHDKEKATVAELRAKGGDVDAAVMSLGLQFQEFKIVGGNARCIATLEVFKKLISEYKTPPGNSLQRHLLTIVNKQLDFLNHTRVLATTMKSAAKHIKSAISNVPIEMPDEDAKTHLRDIIDDFIRDRITLADRMIVEQAMQLDKIRDGDVVLVYGRSSVVLDLLLETHKAGKQFQVIVADSRPKLEGRKMLTELTSHNIDCTYIWLNALGMMMPKVDKVFLGASAVLSNGAILSRVGGAVVAMAAHEAKVPVIVCSETYKFSDVVRLDAFVWNELGNPDELSTTTLSSTSSSTSSSSLVNWRDIPPLKLLNLHYDITPADFVSMVICEHAVFPPTSVGTVMRYFVDREGK